jgi:hypothetical protein
MKVSPQPKAAAKTVAQHTPASKNQPAAEAKKVNAGWVAQASSTRAASAPSGVQRPVVSWSGGVQHNGNNPEVIVETGRSYSSRPLAPSGVGFKDKLGNPVPQRVFSSNKNMTGQAVSESLILSNPGTVPLKLRVQIAISDPPSARGSKTQEITIPPKGSTRVPVGEGVNDGGFTAFNASVVPLDEAAKNGKIHVDVAAHETDASDSSAMVNQPLMKTEGERGFRVPPERLEENKAFTEELRYVMRGAHVDPDPVSNKAAWPDAKVQAWAEAQQALGASGKPTAFDPAVNAGIEGRVNGIVQGTTGSVTGAPFSPSTTGSSATVRVLPNKGPPGFASFENGSARRAGTSNRDAGAYGKAIETILPLTNPTDKPITIQIQLKVPPPGQDGSQLPGHQVYNGPVRITADGGVLANVSSSTVLAQPVPGSETAETLRTSTVASITIKPGATVNLKVGLETHANSQFPIDVVSTRV